MATEKDNNVFEEIFSKEFRKDLMNDFKETHEDLKSGVRELRNKVHQELKNTKVFNEDWLNKVFSVKTVTTQAPTLKTAPGTKLMYRKHPNEGDSCNALKEDVVYTLETTDSVESFTAANICKVTLKEVKGVFLSFSFVIVE
jgi:hypothetical protein